MKDLAVQFAVVAALVAAPVAMGQTYPDSVAALGDSITRAAVADDSADGLNFGQPQHSYATGYEAGDGVNSHFERIQAANPGVVGYNLAESGADMDNLLEQANNAVTVGAEYVIIEMGGNDVCKDSAAEMTSVAQYEAEFNVAADALQAGLPDSLILVNEVPNVKRIYDVGRWNFGCQFKWYLFQFCDSMLRNGSTERNQAHARNIEYNNVLRDEAAARGFAFDDDVFEYNFARSDLSDVDCFHPAISAHAVFADRTYDAARF